MSAIVRLPVQVGTSSLGSLARAAAVLGPGATLAVAGGLRLAHAPGVAAAGLAALGALLVVYAVAEARRAWRTRASDALLGDDLAFEGGAHAGLRLAWSEIDGERTHAETVTDKRLSLAELVAHLQFAVFSALLASQLELAHELDAPVLRLVLVTRAG
ncbi:MAG: hypothetical protein HY908_13670, partial [Myxococcales bacterium]|nr:hypothetical protein [Myxococcales bacterium]